MTMKSNNCPRCFGPRPAHAIYAGSLCPRCSTECTRNHHELVAQGDAASVIIERANIDAGGGYWACEWEHYVGNGEDEPMERIAAGYSAHSTRDGAVYAMAYAHRLGQHAIVTGPHRE